MPAHVRPATPDDAPAIADVLAAAFAGHRASYTPTAYAATTPAAEEVRRRFGEGPMWVATLGGAAGAAGPAGPAEPADPAVGTVSAVARGTDLHVRSMAVLPAARGHGVGAALLHAVEEFAARHGHRRLTLSTTPFLAEAIRLYARAGFRRTEEGPHDLAGTPLFTMVKQIR